MSEQVLSGCVAIVTGASRGVGKGVAIELGMAGATVYFTKDGSDPRLAGGAVNPAAFISTSTTITGNTWLRAREIRRDLERTE